MLPSESFVEYWGLTISFRHVQFPSSCDIFQSYFYRCMWWFRPGSFFAIGICRLGIGRDFQHYNLIKVVNRWYCALLCGATRFVVISVSAKQLNKSWEHWEKRFKLGEGGVSHLSIMFRKFNNSRLIVSLRDLFGESYCSNSLIPV